MKLPSFNPLRAVRSVFSASTGLPDVPLRAASMAIVSCLVAAGGSAIASTDDLGRSASMRLFPAPLGGVSGVDLRTGTPGAPFVLFLGGTHSSADLDGFGPLPYLRVFGPGTTILVASADPTGRFAVAAPVPNVPALAGATVFGQAAVVLADGGIEATNVTATTITPAPTTVSPLFSDASANVPAAAKLFGSGPGAARDLDGDGDPDLVVITGPVGSVHVFRNDGHMKFTDVTSTAIPAAAQIDAVGVELFDADGDRQIDIFVIAGSGDASGLPPENLLLRNLGGLSFGVVPFPAVAGIARAVEVVDLDGDGDLDLLFANGQDGVHASEAPSPNALLVNQGGAQMGQEGVFVVDVAFENAPWNNPDHNVTVVAGDIDNDNDPDVFIGRIDSQALDGTPGQPNVLLRNDGGLSFTDVSLTQLFPLYSDNTQGAAFGDLDGDGLLDLIVANSTVSVVSASSGDYYRNQGGGVFIEDNLAWPQIDESELSLRNGVRLIDVDLDGDLDALVFLHEFLDFDSSTGGVTAGDDMLFVNQGGVQGGAHGTFAVDSGFTSTGIFITGDVVVADFDLDGDADIYVCNTGAFFTPLPVDDRLLENKRIP